MTIPVVLGLLHHEKILLDDYRRQFGEQTLLISKERAANLIPAVFSHWRWHLKVVIDYGLVVDDEEWEPFHQGDRAKIWEVYLRRLYRRASNVNYKLFSRVTALLEGNPQLKEEFLQAPNDDTGLPDPKIASGDLDYWELIVSMKIYMDVFTSNSNIGQVVSSLVTTLSTDHEENCESIQQDHDILKPLPWASLLKEQLIDEYDYYMLSSYQIWSLIRICAIFQRRGPTQRVRVNDALQQTGFLNKYRPVGRFYTEKQSDTLQDLTRLSGSNDMDKGDSGHLKLPYGSFHDPVEYLEYIPWGELSTKDASTDPRKLLWSHPKSVLFDHYLVSEEEVFAFSVESNLVHPDYLENGSVLFIASSLRDSRILHEMRDFWEKWVCGSSDDFSSQANSGQNDCAITKNEETDEWLLLETVPGVQFRRLWDDQDQVAALKYFRRFVDEQRFGRPLRLAEVLGASDFDPEYESLLNIIPFIEITEIDSKPLGSGARGTVYQGKWQCPRKIDMLAEETRSVALKLMKGTNSEERIRFFKELDSMYTALKGDPLRAIAFYGITKTPELSEPTIAPFLPPNSLILVTQLAVEGSLVRYLKNHLTGEHSDWTIIFNCMRDIAQGLNDLHRHKIVHRDLHEGNIVVRKRRYEFDPLERDSFEALVTDLGESYNVSNLAKPTRSYYGDRDYWAPEIKKNHKYSTASDMYALGCLIKAMVAVKFEIDQDKTSVRNNVIPTCIIGLGLSCLASDPEQRATAFDFVRKAERYHELYFQMADPDILDFSKDMIAVDARIWQSADSLIALIKEEERSSVEMSIEGRKSTEDATRNADVDDDQADMLDEFGIPL